MKSCGIIGNGFVGRATSRVFMEHVESLKVFDTIPERANAEFSEVCRCDVVFICVPTPMKNDDTGNLELFDGRVDLSAVHGVFRRIQQEPRDNIQYTNFVLKSTVPVGTTAAMAAHYNIPRLIHSPEFLTARRAVEDAHCPSRNLIGSVAGNGGSEAAAVLVGDAYRKRFPGVPVYTSGSNETEFVKLMQNSFFADKVAFFNEFYEWADKLDLNWEGIMEGLLSDGRIAHSHTQVPGHDGRRGYGGTCLPKDLQNAILGMTGAGLDPQVCRAIWHRNLKDRNADV